MTLIKICGLQTPELAARTVQLGADFIGLVFTPKSPRFISGLDQAKEIVSATQEAGGQAVAVFMNQSAEEINHICQTINADYAQLHGENILEVAPKVNSNTGLILATNNVPDSLLGSLRLTQPTPFANHEAKVGCVKERSDEHNNSKTNYLIIDHATPGFGKEVDLNNLEKPKHPFFLAGGLTPDNVQEKIKIIQPTGVDVSSGVEASRGQKDFQLIQQFIERVKTC
jgi:phosphoribosylanthranilate isomerase